MKKLFAFVIFSLLIINILNGAIPPGYYDTATGTGYTLKTQLYNIIKNPSVTSYAGLWTSFKTTDKRPDNGKVWDIYSDIPGSTPPYEFIFETNQCGTYSVEGDCYNREHSFPSSWFGNASPMYSDLFQIYPTDGYVNNRRGSYPYGEITSPTWTSLNGSKLGPCSYPGYTATVFEPIDDFKGDVARSYFYMATSYENLVTGWSSVILDGTSDHVYVNWFLDMIIQWHQNDPVSTKEINRNDAVYGIQGNRNPFIDHPEYVCEIWSSTSCATCDTNDISSPDWQTSGLANLTVTPGNTQNSLSWDTATDVENPTFVYYALYRDTVSGFAPGSSNMIDTGLTSITYLDTGLTNDTTYYYRLMTYNCNGNSRFNTDEASGTPFGGSGSGPKDISGWKITQIDNGANFTFPAGTLLNANNYLILGRNVDKTSFESFWGITLDADAVYINSANVCPQINGGETYKLEDDAAVMVDGITGLTLSSGQTAQRNNPGDDPTLTGSWTSQSNAYSNPGSGVGTLSNAGVVINEYSDASDYNNEFVELYYDAGGVASVCDPSDVTAPQWNTASGIIVTDQQNGTLKISWLAPIDVENPDIYYALYRDTISGFTPNTSTLIDTALTSTLYTDSGLTLGATYYYIIQAYNCAGLQTNNTDENFARVTYPARAPILQNTIAGDSQVTLSWSSVSGSDEYRLYYATVSGGPYSLFFSTTGTSFIHKGLNNGTTYYYVVKNYDSARYPPLSDYSNEMSSTPQIVSASSAIDISGWQIFQYNSLQTYTFPAGTTIPAGAYLVLARNADKALFESTWGITLPSNCVYLNSGGTSVPQINGGEIFELRNDIGTTIDTSVTTLSSGGDIYRNNPGDPGNQAASWTVTTDASSTPGSGVGTSSDAGIVINEYSDASDYNYEFVELYYDSTAADVFGLLSAQAPLLNRVEFEYNDYVDQTSGTNASNYSIYESTVPANTISVNSISLYSDNRKGYMDIANLTANIEYTLEVTGSVYNTSSQLIDSSLTKETFVAPIQLETNANPILFPEWSFDGTKIAYIEYDKTSQLSNIFVQNRDGTGKTQVTLDLDNVLHVGQISFSPDDQNIIFTADGGGYTQIRKIPVIGGSSTLMEPPSSIWGRWLDPSWGSSVNQFGAIERVACSISGELWVFDPSTITNTFSSLIKLTELTTGNYQDTYAVSDKLLQPKWSPDNTRITFVRRYAGTGVVDSDIYVLNNVQTIIQNNIPVTSWTDTNISLISDNNYPTWSPSISVDGTQVSYVVDNNDVFDNVLFWSDPDGQFANTNFDAYYEYSNGSQLNGYVLEANSYNEGFMKWAPAGGDQFIYTTRDSGGNYSLQIINHTVTSGFVKGSTLNVKDYSFSGVNIDNSDGLFTEITMESPLQIPNINEDLKYIGESRYITIDGMSDVSLKGNISIQYMNSEVRNIVNPISIAHFNEVENEWEIISSNRTKNDLGGIISCNITSLGYYAIASIKTNKSDSDTIIVYPNPFKPTNTEINIETDYVVKSIDIYTIAGEKLDYTIGNFETFSPVRLTNGYKLSGDKMADLASGIYLIVIKGISGESKVLKLAIVK
jgi:endonuclease I